MLESKFIPADKMEKNCWRITRRTILTTIIRFSKHTFITHGATARRNFCGSPDNKIFWQLPCSNPNTMHPVQVQKQYYYSTRPENERQFTSLENVVYAQQNGITHNSFKTCKKNTESRRRSKKKYVGTISKIISRKKYFEAISVGAFADQSFWERLCEVQLLSPIEGNSDEDIFLSMPTLACLSNEKYLYHNQR